MWSDAKVATGNPDSFLGLRGDNSSPKCMALIFVIFLIANVKWFRLFEKTWNNVMQAHNSEKEIFLQFHNLILGFLVKDENTSDRELLLFWLKLYPYLRRTQMKRQIYLIVKHE